MRVGRLAEEGRAIGVGRQLVGQELADLVELRPGFGRRQVVAELGLELLLDLRIAEDVLAIVEDEDVAIVGEAVDLAVDLHLVVAIGRRDVLQLVVVAVFLDIGVEHFQRAGLGRDRASRRE